MSALFAQKLGMTHVYNDANRHIPVTILKVTDQAVSAIRSRDKDGYDAIQIGSSGKKKINKPQVNELIKNNIELPIAHRREIALPDDRELSIGQILTVNEFQPGDIVMVTATSKGKGFAGTVKRHNFHRGPETHGSKNVRKPGSIGGGYPQRVLLGRQMPGHMGAETVTTRGLKVVAINEADNTMAISGAVPGANKSRVFIRKQK